MSTYDPAAGFTGTPDPTRWAESQAIIAAARQAAGGASLDIFPAADFGFVDRLTGDPILAEALEDIATVTRTSKAWSMGWDGVNGNPAGALIEHASGKAAWSPYGLLVAPSVENLVPNPRGEGAALPAWPTGWAGSATGATVTPTARGVIDGWPYVDVTVHGTVTAAGLISPMPASTALIAGDVATAQVGAALVSGSAPNLELAIVNNAAAIQGASVAVSLTGRHRRWALTRTLAAGSTSGRPWLLLPTGVYTNAVIRVFTPVLTKTDYLTHPVLPPVGTPGASVKAQDSVSVATSLGWYRHSEGTLLADFTAPYPSSRQALLGIGRITHSGFRGRGIQVTQAGVVQGWGRDDVASYVGSAGNAVSPGDRVLGAISWSVAGQKTAVNGQLSALYGAGLSLPSPTSFTPYGINTGTEADGRSASPAHRFRFFPRALSDAELQAITTPYWSA